MNKFYDTLTNTRGESLPGHRAQVVNPGGTVVDIYADRGGTRFTDASGAVVNYAVADREGLVEFYWEAATGQIFQMLDPSGDLVKPIEGFADNFVIDNFGGELPIERVVDLADELLALNDGLAGAATTAALASTEAGKGAALIKKRNARLPDILPVTPLEFGAAVDGSTDDLAAVDDAVAEMVPHTGFSGTARLTRGMSVISGPVEVANHVNIEGEGKDASKIIGPAGQPCFKNGDPVALIFSRLEGFQTVGGSHGLHVTGYTDHLTLRDLAIVNATTAGIEIDGFFQTSTLDNVRIAGCPYGIKSDTTIANNIVLIRPDITACETAIALGGAEDFVVVGGRFEGGGHATRAILEIDNCKVAQFAGGYFEGGSLKLLRATNSRIEFVGTHFTAHTLGPDVAYTWDIDSSTRLTFRNCHSTVPMTVPAGSVVENCSGITVSSAYSPTLIVDGGGNNRASSQDCRFWRESNGRVRVRLLVTLNAAAPGFLKITLPTAFPVTETGILNAYNLTTSVAYAALANDGDDSAYVLNGGSDVGTTSDQILIEGTYRIAG